jgi:hypothetical protein
MTKHERVLDSAMEKINKIVESARQDAVPNYQSNRPKSENKSYKDEMSDFLGK